MAYGYTRNYGRSGGNYQNRQYSYGNNRGYNASPQRKKRSGAKFVYDKEGNKYISAWNASKANGLVTFFVSEYKKSKTSVSKNGIEWVNMMVKISRKMQKDEIVGGMLKVRTGKVIVKELGIVINPSAPNGGYCGTFVRKNR